MNQNFQTVCYTEAFLIFSRLEVNFSGSANFFFKLIKIQLTHRSTAMTFKGHNEIFLNIMGQSCFSNRCSNGIVFVHFFWLAWRSRWLCPKMFFLTFPLSLGLYYSINYGNFDLYLPVTLHQLIPIT